MEAQIKDLQTFYLERDPNDWFVTPEGLDDELRRRYSDLVQQARSGELDYLADTANGAVALIVLLDQIPRNIFRGSGESFSSDSKALKIATKSIALKFDHEIGKRSRAQQLLFYMPLMHAEDMMSQIACCALLRNVLLECPDDHEMKGFLEQGVSAAQKHLDCIWRLGRFPKRNVPLGRNTTAEEEKFLEEFPGGF